jgi:hypothetical protein
VHGVEARVFFDSASKSTVVDQQPSYPHEYLQPAFSLRRRNYQDDKDWAEQASMGFALGISRGWLHFDRMSSCPASLAGAR